MSIIFSTVATRAMRATRLRLNRKRKRRGTLDPEKSEPQQDPDDETPDKSE
jgi:hypothetical protein